MITNFSAKASVLTHYIAQMRDVKTQGDKLHFRNNMKRIANIMAYEISKELKFESVEIETPLGVAPCKKLGDKIVLASILRAGLPMHDAFLNIFDQAENAFISAYRQHHKDGSFDIKLEYVTCPRIESKVLILIDPMLATGASIENTLSSLEEYGKPKEIHIATIIASTQGVNHIKRLFPKAKIWAGAIDDELTAKSYIVPGLGDAGDLAFGSKLQE